MSQYFFLVMRTFTVCPPVCSVTQSCPSLFKPVGIACRAPLTMEYFKQEYWSGLPFPPPGDLPKLRIKHESPASLALVGRYFSTVPPGKPHSLF